MIRNLGKVVVVLGDAGIGSLKNKDFNFRRRD